jgi:hypothetical protein
LRAGVQGGRTVPVYPGSIFVNGDKQPVDSKLMLGNDVLVLTAVGEELGRWGIDQFEYARAGDTLTIDLGDEQVVFKSPFTGLFSQALADQRRTEAQRKPGTGRHTAAPASRTADFWADLLDWVEDHVTLANVARSLGITALGLLVLFGLIRARVITLYLTAGVTLALALLSESGKGRRRLPRSWTTSRLIVAGFALFGAGFLSDAL